MLENFETIYISTNWTVPSFIADSAILCHFMPNDSSLWGSSLISSIPPQKLVCRLKSSPLHTAQSSYELFSYQNISIKGSYPKWTYFIEVAQFPCLCGTIESCRVSVRCLEQYGALQHLEIKIMMDVYQTVLANTSPNYNVFWVIFDII